MEYTTFTQETWSPQYLPMRVGDHSFFFISDGVHIIYSRAIDSTTFTHDRRSPHHLHIRDGIVALVPFHVVRGTYTVFSHYSTQHFLTTHGVHNIHSQEMESKAITQERWSPQHLLKHMECTAFSHESWGPQHIFLTDGVHSI